MPLLCGDELGTADVADGVGSGLHIEKAFDADGIAGQPETYLPLVPDSTNRKATMLIGSPEVNDAGAISLG